MKKNLIIGGLTAIVAGAGYLTYSLERSYEARTPVTARKESPSASQLNQDEFMWKTLEKYSNLSAAEKATVFCGKNFPLMLKSPASTILEGVFARNKDVVYFIIPADSELATKLCLEENSFGLYKKGNLIEQGAIGDISNGIIDLAIEIDWHFSCNNIGLSRSCRDYVGLGKLAPDFRAKTLDGKEISLSDYRNRVVLLDFWAEWCPPCIEKVPSNKELFNKYQSKITFIGVCVSSDKVALEKTVKHLQIPYNQICDGFGLETWEGPISKKYQITQVPQTILIDASGHVAERLIGSASDMESEIEKLVRLK